MSLCVQQRRRCIEQLGSSFPRLRCGNAPALSRRPSNPFHHLWYARRLEDLAFQEAHAAAEPASAYVQLALLLAPALEALKVPPPKDPDVFFWEVIKRARCCDGGARVVRGLDVKDVGDVDKENEQDKEIAEDDIKNVNAVNAVKDTENVEDVNDDDDNDDDDDDDAAMIRCRHCGGRAFWQQRQTRSADEPMTIFATCSKCRSSWRF